MAFGLNGDPQGVQESYPTPGTGVGVPESIQISGTGVSQATSSVSNVFKATISSNKGSFPIQLALTANPVDAAGNGCNAGPVQWVAYPSAPASFAAADPAGVIESYPGNTTGVPPQGFASISVNQAGLVTANAEGVYIIEARCIAGAVSAGSVDSSGSATGLSTKSSVVYGQLILTVTY